MKPRYKVHTTSTDPVPEDTRVQVVLRDSSTPVSTAGFLDWSRGTDRDPGDIIAYRVIEQE